MRMKIVKPIAILLVLIGMVGIAGAYDCPGPDTWATVNHDDLQYFYTIAATGDNPVTYSAGGISSTNSIREVCIASKLYNANSGTVIWDLWQMKGVLTIKSGTPQWPRTWGQFKDGGTPNDVPSDGSMHDVGTLLWDVAPGTNQEFVLHVQDPRCGGDGTCYVIPKGRNPPVPELSPLILTSAGLIGIVFVSRKYKSR